MELKFFFISKLFILKIYYKIILYFFNLHIKKKYFSKLFLIIIKTKI